jgi:hypothetical protein
MPYGDPAPSDPNILVGVSLPADEGAVSEMAYVFAEEFARMGFDERQLLKVFKNPFYAGAHQAYCALGEQAVRRIIEECVGVWGSHQRFAILDCRLRRKGKSKIQNLKSKMERSHGQGS